MRVRVAPVILLVLALASPAVLGSPAAEDDPGALPSYIVLLSEQHGHAASLDVRERLVPAISDLAAQRSLLVRTPEDLADPAVYALNVRIDRALTDLRVAIAGEATRRHEPSRAVVEALVAELGGVVMYRAAALNLLAVRLPPNRVDALRAHPGVVSVEPDEPLDFLLDVSVPSVGASSFWTGGFTGGPFELIVPDTGIDSAHPALSTKMTDQRVFHAAAQGNGDYNDDASTTDDLHGHGTHVAGIVASTDASYRGVAYGLFGVINVKFGYRTTTGNGRGEWSDAFQGIDWAVLQAGGDVLSLSFGGGFGDTGTAGPTLFMDAVVDDLGVPMSLAAGNSGSGSGTVIIPATAFNALTVGAIDDGGTPGRGDDAIWGLSSRGPTADGRIKPDIVAPGVFIRSANNEWEGASPDFVDASGTSMASPHVGAALVLYEHASGTGFPARSKAVLLNSAEDRGTAGPDNAYGWGYLDLAAAWPQRNNVVEGNVAQGAPAFYRVTGVAGDRATLVWQRHVVYRGASVPSSWLNLNDVDLFLYSQATQVRLATSSRTRDNVEQVAFPSATTGILKVFAPVPLQGVSQEPFALAARTAITPVGAPALSASMAAPSFADSGQNFAVNATITNTGGLAIGTASVALSLPPGVTLVSGANPTSLGAIAPGASRGASWTVTTTVVGTHTFTASATGTAYEESYAAAGGPVSTTVRDTMPPTISAPSANPSPQNVGGAVNVSAAIADNVGVVGRWVRVLDPAGGPIGNFTMLVDPASGRSYYARPYADLGTHTFRISAADAAGNWATSDGSFVIADLESPVLSAVSAAPDPQEVFFPVNVSATATDNVGVAAAFLEVVDPFGASTNASMNRAGTAVWLDRPYGLVGTYAYVLSARDDAMNWAVASGSFAVRDTTAPVADAGPDRLVEAGTTVTFDAGGSTDNVGIVAYEWRFFDGAPVLLTGVTASYAFANLGTFPVTLTVRDAAGNSATDTLTVVVRETKPPEIHDVRAEPPLQDIGGTVRISAVVFDAFSLAGVWLEVRDPAGATVNVTMSPSAGRYARALQYWVKGVHWFTISASDANGNWNESRGMFEIADLTPPAVQAAATPDPVDAFAPATVTATVVENDAVSSVRLEVRDPAGNPAASLPMAFVSGEWRATYTPTVLGVHAAIVWATDASGNVGSASLAIRAVDREAPTIAASAPAAVEVLTVASVTAAIQDNLGPFVATLEVRDPAGRVLANRTLLGASPFVAGVPYDVLGPHAWTVYAVDPSGNGAVATGTTLARDTIPPTADAGPDRTVVAGTWVPLDASGSRDNYGIESYTWNFTGNGQEQVLRGVRHAFAFLAPGTVVVRLLVLDLSGNPAEDTATITVLAPDRDGDGWRDDEEALRGTDPLSADTDGDGIPDPEDPDPLVAAFDVQTLFFSWWGILVLLVLLLVILAAGARRRPSERERPAVPSSRAPPAAQARPPRSAAARTGTAASVPHPTRGRARETLGSGEEPPPPPDDELPPPPPPDD